MSECDISIEIRVYPYFDELYFGHLPTYSSYLFMMSHFWTEASSNFELKREIVSKINEIHK